MQPPRLFLNDFTVLGHSSRRHNANSMTGNARFRWNQTRIESRRVSIPASSLLGEPLFTISSHYVTKLRKPLHIVRCRPFPRDRSPADQTFDSNGNSPVLTQSVIRCRQQPRHREILRRVVVRDLRDYHAVVPLLLGVRAQHFADFTGSSISGASIPFPGQQDSRE